MSLSILSKCVITTISGSPKVLTSYRVSGLIGVLLIPDTTQTAYYGKYEQKLDTTCF